MAEIHPIHTPCAGYRTKMHGEDDRVPEAQRHDFGS